jgi:DnaJ like chaperone protein
MAWAGKAFWTGAGWAIGGPIGGIVGAIIGAAIDEKEEEQEYRNQAALRAAVENQARREQLLFVSIFSMAAKMAKADGNVGQEEVSFLTNFMKEALELSPDRQKEAIQIFGTAKNANQPIEDYAKEFYSEYANEQDRLLSMLHLLFYIAAADGILHLNEEKMLMSVAQIFRISMDQYKEIKIEFFGDTDQWYTILGCSSDDDNETIKKKYRKLALEYHPDRLASQKNSPDAIRTANFKFQQINEAYDMIKKQRNIN